jgi:pimeloyl-ACP methyl ester carboxylesterase
MQILAMKFFKWLGIIALVLIILYFLGPKPATPKYVKELPAVPAEPLLLEKYVRDAETSHKLKPDNQARIAWQNDSLKQKTAYAVVYLHGFSASQEEGDPVHTLFAKQFGCNLYLSRLAEHGMDTVDAMIGLTADKLWNSAKEAYAVGRQLGNKVILLATSSGATLALKLAAEYPDIAGLILLSPNIAINDPLAWVANNHWGLQVAHLVKGKYNTTGDTTAMEKKYWYNKYRMESVTELQELLETTMKASLFEKIKQPVLMLYYYKDEEHQDKTVKVSAMKRMFRQLGTPDSLKREIAVPNAEDHVIGSYITSKDLATVENECLKFGEQVLRLPVLKQ